MPAGNHPRLATPATVVLELPSAGHRGTRSPPPTRCPIRPVPSKCRPQSSQARWLPGLPWIPRQPANHITSGAPPGHRRCVPLRPVAAVRPPVGNVARGLRSWPLGPRDTQRRPSRLPERAAGPLPDPAKPIEVSAMIEPGAMSAGPLRLAILPVRSPRHPRRRPSRRQATAAVPSLDPLKSPRRARHDRARHDVSRFAPDPEAACQPRHVKRATVPPRSGPCRLTTLATTVPEAPDTAHQGTRSASPGPPSRRHRVPVLPVAALLGCPPAITRGLRPQPPWYSSCPVLAIEAPGRRHRPVARSAQSPSTCRP